MINLSSDGVFFSKVMNHYNSFLFAGNVDELLLDCASGCMLFFVVLDI